MVQSKSVFIDSNYFCGLYNPQDTLNQKSIGFSRFLKKENYRVYISNYIVAEVLTIVAQKVGKKFSLRFWKKINNSEFKIIYVDQKLQRQSFNIFREIKSKNVSFVDASNLALIKKYKINYLLTFDYNLLKIAESLGIKSL